MCLYLRGLWLHLCQPHVLQLIPSWRRSPSSSLILSSSFVVTSGPARNRLGSSIRLPRPKLWSRSKSVTYTRSSLRSTGTGTSSILDLPKRLVWVDSAYREEVPVHVPLLNEQVTVGFSGEGVQGNKKCQREDEDNRDDWKSQSEKYFTNNIFSKHPGRPPFYDNFKLITLSVIHLFYSKTSLKSRTLNVRVSGIELKLPDL